MCDWKFGVTLRGGERAAGAVLGTREGQRIGMLGCLGDPGKGQQAGLVVPGGHPS